MSKPPPSAKVERPLDLSCKASEEGFIAGCEFHIPVCMRTFEVVFRCEKAMVDCGRCQVYIPFYCSLLLFFI